MSPYERTQPGGSVEQWHEEPGISWLRRVLATWPRAAWLNPSAPPDWSSTPTIGMICERFDEGRFARNAGQHR
jgi:uncharacterized protein with von Willebrand factor type A (vWA) domain